MHQCYLSLTVRIIVVLFEYFRHRHVPKAVFKAAKEKKIMLASIKKKYVVIVNLHSKCYGIFAFPLHHVTTAVQSHGN